MDAREELSRCIIDLLLKEPFFGHLLSGVVRVVGDATPTAAVSLTPSGVQLSVNPAFFCEELRKRTERVAVVKHECLHLLFKHLFRHEPGRDPRIFNIAADLVVNQFVRPWTLPDSAVTLESFPDLSLEPDRTVEHYYDALSGLLAEMRGAGFGGDDARPGDFSDLSAPRSADALADRMGSTWHSDHDGWGPPEDVPDAVRKALESQLDRAIVQARDRAGPRAWGRLPGPLQRLVEAALERRKPQVDWRRCVRLFGASSRRTRIVGTYRRESRRYGRQSFLGDGSVPTPGIKVRSLSRLAVAVDTSGSVSDRELSLFFGEIRGLWRQGAQVDVIECDARIQRVYPYAGRLPDRVSGRGGTSFDPVFVYLREQIRRTRYDGVIYLTDGGAPSPEVVPPCKLLWVVTSDGAIGDHLRHGRVIQLPAS